MSAYVPDKFHIDLMVDLAVNSGSPYGPLAWYTTGDDTDRPIRHEARDCNAVGQMLVDEVVASVGFRYETPPGGDLPGPIAQYWQKPYVWTRPSLRLTPVEGLSAIHCYEYQACERKEWHTSNAEAFCRALTRHLIHALPGYDDAPWEWTPRTKREVAA